MQDQDSPHHPYHDLPNAGLITQRGANEAKPGCAELDFVHTLQPDYGTLLLPFVGIEDFVGEDAESLAAKEFTILHSHSRMSSGDDEPVQSLQLNLLPEAAAGLFTTNISSVQGEICSNPKKITDPENVVSQRSIFLHRQDQAVGASQYI
jgi:hypothetical protein